MWPIFFSIAGSLLLVAVAVCAWLTAARSALQNERDHLKTELAESETQAENYRLENAQVKKDLAVSEEKCRSLDEAQKSIRESFKAAASDVLKESNQQFLHLAKKTFEGEQKDAVAQLEQRRQAIDALVKPIKESLDKYQTSVQQIEASRKEAYGSLQQQVKTVTEGQQRLQKETANLVTALRRPGVRGRWGELQLKRVAELAGMSEHCDFTLQETVSAGDGPLRPDMIVRLPGGRVIVVDAKTPLEAFLNAIDCPDENQQRELFDSHAKQVEKHVKDLASKQYSSQFDRAVDFVVLFIPGEGFLHAAAQARPSLIEDAMARNVVIATPGTLMALLRAVAQGWREQQVSENAQRVSELGRELHKRLGVAFDHLANLCKAIGSTVSHFNKLVGSLENSVLPQARRFEELKSDSPNKLPEQFNQVEVFPREPVKGQVVISDDIGVKKAELKTY